MVVISHFKLYPALFPLKWLICIPNILGVRGNVVFETLHDFYRTAILKNTWYSVVLIPVDIYSLLLKRPRCKINYDTASWQINGYQYGRCLFFTALEHKFMMETPERIRIYEHLPFIWQISFFDKNIID